MSRRGWRIDEWAQRVADALDGAHYINLGVGMPAKLPQYLLGRMDALFQCENGIIGTGASPADGEEVEELIDASTNPVTLQEGAAIVPLDVSFSIIRGRHLDATVLGAFQVSATGDLANWSGPADAVAGVGGAMDLAFGANRTCVMMHHRHRDGTPKIVPDLTYPVTAPACVDVIVTEFAVIDVTDQGLLVREVADDVSRDELVAWTGAPLRFETIDVESGAGTPSLRARR